MAYNITITEKSANRINEKKYLITINAIITDDSGTVFLDKDYSEKYYTELSINTLEEKFQDKIKVDWDNLIKIIEFRQEPASLSVIPNIQSNINTFLNMEG